MAVTSSNLNRFSNFFYNWKEKKIPTKPMRYFPLHLKYVAKGSAETYLTCGGKFHSLSSGKRILKIS